MADTFLPDADLTRLTKLLGMLGSNAENERAVAAAMATRLLADHRMSWGDVGNKLRQAPVMLSAPPRPVDISDHRIIAARCRMSGVSWRKHEREFIEQMCLQNRKPSEKQMAWLRDLQRRVQAQSPGGRHAG